MLDDQVLLGLHEAAARDRGRVGSKAAVLATLLQADFPVPAGTVLTAEAFGQFMAGGDGLGIVAMPGPVHDALRQIADRYGNVPLAVRSSALAEDLEEATFAGQYETVLDVRGLAALEEAVRRCWASLAHPGVDAYRLRLKVDERQAMAVLVQPMITPDAAGVALGADPITGERAKVLVSAVRGSGAPLVSGAAIAEDWEVTPTGAACRSTGSGVLTAGQASAVAKLLRRVEGLLGGPQDLEWAIAGGKVFVLQARPMTSLPAETRWSAPLPGGWLRSIRLGEWLPEPVTPLFETWLLERVEEQFRQRQAADGGIKARPPLHVCVHGWYFHSPIGSGRQTLLLRGFLRRPRLAAATVLAARRPAVADWLFYGAFASQWRASVLFPYQRLVADGERRVMEADAAELIRMVDRIADVAGDFFWSLVLAGGAAWRFEIALARFHHRHLKAKVASPYQVMLGGLESQDTPGHAVHSLDWIRETAGELPPIAADPQLARARHEKAVTERLDAEAACKRALAARPRRLARFIALLGIAQRYAVLRADHGRSFTLAWPLLRQCAYRLGAQVSSAGLLDRPEDIFFITATELGECLAGRPPVELAAFARERRAAWERQRRLSPPLTLGRPPFLLSRLLLSSPKVVRSPSTAGEQTLRGTPASPGRAAGPVRILRDPAAARCVRQGDVLVVSAVVPALTPVFDRIAALCADSGSVAAHASLIAREYGIPAVTGLGDATSRLTDDTWVTVDGTAGVVEFQ
jgi:pyruvate,water dikinase